ncbi:uncharacterized protein N7446_011021 [Penicillium canescens]|uniref:DUF1750-domain-containing protein n=1 Tax=Penicillium canescens TaxID=5083 RepID=A0AAD6IHH2_PENCN|nr:uncharacterized protein N7446_011021 [Penicillium canescens]KAJ6048058.1 hypothetical protein N7460_004205 [Penicillium canescens]KAJ6048338.1 hypothetical protein N7446_011021 [Penicillium canescens]
MDDPAARIPGQLLPHMHLISRNRYPSMHMMPTETAVEYLTSAPRICQTQPMHWTFLEAPPDGTVMLTWQPLAHLGNNFASDGYVWADAEQAFTFEARGYTVEMYLQRCGLHPPNEPMATHCRKRYRITSCKVPNAPQPDPSLWIVHYSRAAPTDHIPSNRVPVTPQIQATMAQRRFLQSQGQLARKDFLLHDRNSWPTINFPQMAPQGFAQPPAPFAGHAPARPGFYPQGHPGAMPAGVPVAKGPRGHRAPSAAMGAATADFAIEDEDVSSGDAMDLLTPREVSKMRYQQHHEWMEEIFASPYAITQITPVSLGLGRKGELESLTAGFFDAPVGTSGGEGQEAGDGQPATKMEPAKAEEFAERVSKKVADMTAEIEKMKKQHARRMQRFNRTSLLRDAEIRLRESAADPAEKGPEIWRLEGRVVIPTEEETPQLDYVEDKAKYKVDDIVREVETAWKKQIVSEPKVSCVEKGGLLEKIEPEHKDEPESFTNDMVMDHDDAHLLNQFGSPVVGGPGMSSVSVNGQPIPAGISADIDMDLGDQLHGAPNGETNDWVMVNETKDHGPVGGEFDFTNIDSAGDALAAYSEQNDGLDLPDLDNSAFGDAFHASDNEHSHNPDADEI